MSNRIKIVIAIGIIGVVLLVAGTVMGSGPASIPAIFSEANVPEGAVDISAVTPSDVHSVILNLTASDISIRTGEAFSLSGSGVYDSYVLNGAFYAGASENKRTAKALGMNINVPSKWVAGYGSYVLVIPPDAELDQITINTTQCDITCDSLIAGKVEINMTGGDLSIDNLTANTATLNVPKGKVTVGAAQIRETGSITSKKALSIGSADTAETNQMNNLTLSNARGGITLYGKLTGAASLTANRNNIEAFLVGSRNNYQITSPDNNLAVHTAVSTNETGKDDTEHYANVTLEAKKGSCDVMFQ